MLWIDRSLFDAWMSLNGGDYQLGNSPICMALWNDVEQEKIVARGVAQRRAAKDYCYEEELLGQRVIERDHCPNCPTGYRIRIHWKLVKTKKDLSLLDAIWSFSSKADANKTNISASQVIWHSTKLEGFTQRFDQFLPILGITAPNITAAAIAIHCLGNPSVEKILKYVITNRDCCLDAACYAAIFKAVGVALRRSAHWPDNTPATLDEVAHCAAWDLAIGRSLNTSDWDDERSKRVGPTINLKMPHEAKASPSTNEGVCALLRTKLEAMMSQLLAHRRCTDSFEDFVKNRQSWVSAGSTGGFRVCVDGEKIKANKHVMFEELTWQEMVGWLNKEPRTEAVASEKYEMGKARAIYGTKPLDYAISSYILNDLEPKLHLVKGIESGLTGMDIITSMIHRQAVAREPGTECTMIDYADFNYQHTLLAQATVFEALENELQRTNSHPDKIAAARWTKEALLNQWCRFPMRNKADKITQGMFSGCRGTNFINTCLNLAYFQVAADWVGESLLLHADTLFNLHQGDDVWISNKSRLWGVAVFRAMQAMGFDFQASKQMFDVCRAEFLRVLYSEQGCMGYMARAVGTLIMKPIQSVDIVGPAERALSIHSQVCLIKRRGFTQEGAEILWEAMVPYAASVSLPKGGFKIPRAALLLSPAQGGLGLTPPGSLSEGSSRIACLPTIKTYSKELERVIKRNMSKDWISIVSRKVAHSFDSKALEDMAHASNVTDSLRPLDRLYGLRELEKNLREWKETAVINPVRCNQRLMSEFFSQPCYLPLLEEEIKLLIDDKLLMAGNAMRGPIQYILLAVTLSPFKSIPAASVSLKGEWVNVVRACVAMCRSDSVRSAASGALEALLSRAGVEVARMLVEGVNLGLGRFESCWHPIVLSWIGNFALERAAMYITAQCIRTRERALEVILYEFHNAVRVLNKYDELKELSRY